MLMASVLPALAGWGGAGRSSNSHWSGSDSWGYQRSQSKGFGRGQEELLLGMAEALSRRGGGRHDRHRSRSSRSRSSSHESGRRRSSHRSSKKDQELENLRRYKEERDAEDRARRDREEREEREKHFRDMEKRILKALPTPAKKARSAGHEDSAAAAGGENSDDADDVALSPLQCKLAQAKLNDIVSCVGATSWDEVEKRLLSASSAKIRDVFSARFPSERLPKSTASRVTKLIKYLQDECTA